MNRKSLNSEGIQSTMLNHLYNRSKKANNSINKKDTKNDMQKVTHHNAFSLLEINDSDKDDQIELSSDTSNNEIVKQENVQEVIIQEVIQRDHVIVENKEDKEDNKDWKIAHNDKYRGKPKYERNYPKRDKPVYIENNNYENDLGNNAKLNTYWTAWVHKINNNDWTISGYQKIYTINSIGAFWRFFNNFHMIDRFNNHLFIMREEIVPIWEDVNNKFGGICSIKIDTPARRNTPDITAEIMTAFCMLIMNESFVPDNMNINGISFSIKKRSVLIKLWTKTYRENDEFIKNMPINLFNKINDELESFDKRGSAFGRKENLISIQYKQIKPEYEI